MKHNVARDEMTPKSQEDEKDSYRVQLNFSGKNLADLDELKDITAASARAEVLRNALRWMYWCAEEVLQGSTIIVEREGKQREVVFPFVKREMAGTHKT